MPSPRTMGREYPNLWGETGWSNSSGSVNLSPGFLLECWADRAPVWLFAWWCEKRVSFVYFLFSLPIWKLDSSHCGFRWKQCKVWHQKFHSRQNFVVLPDLWALRLYFNPQFVTSKYPNPFLEEEISPETKNPLSFSSPMFHHWSHNSCIYYVRIISDFHFLLSV